VLAHVASPDAAEASTLALLLHGYGSDERDLAGLAGYLPQGLPWASIRAPLRDPGFGYAWYSLDNAEFGAQADIEAATEALWEWVDATVPPAANVIPIGFSQGGLMASQLLRTRPDRVPGAAILSGYVMAAPQPGDDVLAQTRPPVMWARGSADLVIPARAVEHAEAWLPTRSTLDAHVYPGLGHSVSEPELAHLNSFVAAIALAT